MSETDLKPKTKPVVKTERPKLHKVILFNDDYTPRDFVTTVLMGEFHLSEDQAYRVMMTAHRKGVCVVSVYPRDIAETKASLVMDYAKEHGHPLKCTAEPEGFGGSDADIRLHYVQEQKPEIASSLFSAAPLPWSQSIQK